VKLPNDGSLLDDMTRKSRAIQARPSAVYLIIFMIHYYQHSTFVVQEQYFILLEFQQPAIHIDPQDTQPASCGGSYPL